MPENKVKHNPVSEWSYFIDAQEIDIRGKSMDIELPKENVEAVCQRLGLVDIKSLKVHVKLKRNAVNQTIHVSGDLVADVEQECVVTGEPVAEQVKDSFESWFAEPNEAVSFTKAKRDRLQAASRDEFQMLEEYDDPEEIIEGKIDLGELIIQSLSLALETYPRMKGARGNFGDPLEEAPEGTYHNPFAALKNWKVKEDKKDK